jgi:ribosome-interacting GTPase 1
MPINLPPEAIAAERRYREAETTEEKIASLEEFLSTIPKHKGTDRLRAGLRKKLSKLRSSSQSKKQPSRQESAFLIDREGAGQIAVIGPTNVGKSSLITALTNATPDVSDAPFTTWTPTPGMMVFENVQIQLIDTPPLDRGYVEPQLLDLIRRADVILLVVDLNADPFQQLEETVLLLDENRIVPLHHLDRYDELRGLVAKPVLVLTNKCDSAQMDEDCEVFRELLEDEWPIIPVSALARRNLDALRRRVFDELGLIRVYSRPPGQEPDFSAPFVLETGATVEDFAAKVHRDFMRDLKSARVWGEGVFDGQLVGRDHILHDGDVVELRI